MFRHKTRASLIHYTVTTVHGGPHVGNDYYRHDVATSPAVALQDREADLSCELCGRRYHLRVHTGRERLLSLLIRLAIFSAIVGTFSIMSAVGSHLTHTYDTGYHSHSLRLLGVAMVGAGVCLNFLNLIVLTMTRWIWPPRYRLTDLSAPADATTADHQPASEAAAVGDAVPAAPRRRPRDSRGGNHRVKLLA